MAKISIQTTRPVVPMIYAYTTPGVSYHDGWTKIGYTEQDVTTRIRQQTHTAGIQWELQWKKNALFDDGSGRSFRDSDFHAYLQKQGVPREAGTEWFQISGSDSKRMINDFRENCGVLKTIGTVAYELRSEQEQAVAQTFDYFQSHQNGEFLWNAKPRFGKTLATYDLCKRLKESKGKMACNILIVTNRPAIANSWYDDFVKFLGTESGFRFVSEVSALKGKPYVLTRYEYTDNLSSSGLASCIEFVSLQDLKGSLYFGGQYDKLKELVQMQWELLVIDEAHEGVDTSKTDVAFHDKIYGEITDTLAQKTEEIVAAPATTEQQQVERLQDVFKKELVAPVMQVTNDTYGADLKAKDSKKLKKQLEQKADKLVTQEYGNYSIQKKTLEAERQDVLKHLHETGQSAAEVNDHFDTLVQEATDAFKERVSTVLEETVPTLCEEVVKTVETQKRERTKETIEDAVRDHLRGFARTIPSFLMAYGDDSTTLETFDVIIPDEVFLEVTSITLDQFRLLRDGGSYIDAETGEEKHYPGKLFDHVVFDDSIKEFLALKVRLSNYFDDTQSEDIFDYIPPQKTNQIFTPKHIVKQMVDLLEQENPGCFDDPSKTFADLYMKSGLYIAEIVKRLFNSNGMKQAYPDKAKRLQHIFEKQVYGLAPTEIIYQIALHFILGFDDGNLIRNHHLRQCDALPLAKNGTLESKLDAIFDSIE